MSNYVMTIAREKNENSKLLVETTLGYNINTFTNVFPIPISTSPSAHMYSCLPDNIEGHQLGKVVV